MPRLQLLTLSLLATAGISLAQVSGTVWEGIPDAGNAGDPANMVGTLAKANFTSAGINYCSTFSDATCTSHAYDVSDFLNNPVFTGQANGFNPTAGLNNTEVQLTGSIFLNAGANSFGIGHDDGLTLAVGGGPGTVTCSTQSGALCVNQPGATGPVVTPFTITASMAGTYNFTLNYAECCGPPAELQFQFASGAPVGGSVPEPSSIALFSTTVAAIGLFLRRRRQA
jgi:hypothetical protein